MADAARNFRTTALKIPASRLANAQGGVNRFRETTDRKAHSDNELQVAKPILYRGLKNARCATPIGQIPTDFPKTWESELISGDANAGEVGIADCDVLVDDAWYFRCGDLLRTSRKYPELQEEWLIGFASIKKTRGAAECCRRGASFPFSSAEVCGAGVARAIFIREYLPNARDPALIFV